MTDRNYNNKRDNYRGGGSRDHYGGGGRDRDRDHYGGGGGGGDRDRDGHGRGYGSRNRFRPAMNAYSHEQEGKKMEDRYTISYQDLTEKDDIVCSPEVLKMECNDFEDMGKMDSEGNVDKDKDGLKDLLFRSIINYGFESPSKIQSCAIPQILAGRDILAQAQSGSGKTGAFVVSSLQLIDENLKKPQVIILSPTYDLAIQTYNVAQALAHFMKDVNFALTVGGVRRADNIMKLGGSIQGNKDPNPAQVVIATPGRLKDIMNDHGHLFDAVKLIIIDECDEILLNFQEDIQFILKKLQNVNYQMCLFSATLTNETIQISEALLQNPVKILIKREKITLKGIEQRYIPVKNSDYKLDILIEMLSVCTVEKFIVYVNTINNLNAVKQNLENEGFPVLTINSTMTKAQRAQILLDFKNGQTRCLISTDLLSRGIDIQQLSLVVNYDLPYSNKISNYIHRIGRTGRFGKKGYAINLVDDNELKVIKNIELTFKCGIQPLNPQDLETINF